MRASNLIKMDSKEMVLEDRDRLKRENTLLTQKQQLGNVLLEYFTVLLAKEEKRHRYLLSTRNALRANLTVLP